jgi:type I restriction enzyme M protein
VLEAYEDLLVRQTRTRAERTAAQRDLDQKIDAKYSTLTEAEVKTLVIDDKWVTHLSGVVQGEVDRVSQTLTGRVRQLTERYTKTLAQLTAEVESLTARVKTHLVGMGAIWP